MEQRTATHEATSASEEIRAERPRKKERKDEPSKEEPRSGVVFRTGKQLFSQVARPASRVWEAYLREPVAKGLITTGAVLTETGRLILNYGQEKAGASAAKSAASKQTLH